MEPVGGSQVTAEVQPLSIQYSIQSTDYSDSYDSYGGGRRVGGVPTTSRRQCSPLVYAFPSIAQTAYSCIDMMWNTRGRRVLVQEPEPVLPFQSIQRHESR